MSALGQFRRNIQCVVKRADEGPRRGGLTDPWSPVRKLDGALLICQSE